MLIFKKGLVSGFMDKKSLLGLCGEYIKRNPSKTYVNIESKGYSIRNLYVVTEKESQRFDDLREDSCTEAVKFIRDAIKKGRLERLDAKFGEGDAYYISIYAEKSRSAILIHDDIQRKSYNYRNQKHENDETEVELAGYYFPQMIVCEDKDILLDIVLHYFETGKIHEKYEWFELDD